MTEILAAIGGVAVLWFLIQTFGNQPPKTAWCGIHNRAHADWTTICGPSKEIK
jgi:hypothetical protein